MHPQLRLPAHLSRALRPVRRASRRALAPLDEHLSTRRQLRQLGEPVTFNEKVRYKLLADRRPLLTTFADKLAVREYVQSKVGASVLTELYLTTDAPGDLMDAALPREFVLKPTHASGACVVVADCAPPTAELPAAPEGFSSELVTPGRLELDRLVDLCSDWLSRGYRPQEWAYRNVPRRILVEELLLDGGELPPDFKFFVFHGRARLVQVDLDRFEEHARTLYTTDWERLDARVAKYPAGCDVTRPETLSDMLAIAEVLGADTDFVRVDLYSIGDRIVFGELTNYPEAGLIEFVPPEFDHELGAWWTPPRKYRRHR